jgi:hypothetical protein
MRVYYKKLDVNTVRAIENGQLDRYQLQKLSEEVSKYVSDKKKGTIIALAMIIIMSVFMTASTLMNSNLEDPTLLLSMLVPMFLVLILIVAFTGWFFYGRVKSQFNKALQKGYPGSYAEFII